MLPAIDAIEAFFETPDQALGLGRVGGDDRWREISLRHRRHQPAAALPEWLVDDRLTVSAGPHRLAYLRAALERLDRELATHGGRLRIVHGRPEDHIPELVATTGATAVHLNHTVGPIGRRRAATIAAEPPDEPPGVNGRLSPFARQGFSTGP